MCKINLPRIPEILCTKTLNETLSNTRTLKIRTELVIIAFLATVNHKAEIDELGKINGSISTNHNSPFETLEGSSVS